MMFCLQGDIIVRQLFEMLYMGYKVTAHEAGLSNRLSRARLRPTLLASDAVEVVHDVSTCVMVDILVVVTSGVVLIDVASRLSWNSPIGMRAGSSHSGGTSQHLAGLVYLSVGVGLG